MCALNKTVVCKNKAAIVGYGNIGKMYWQLCGLHRILKWQGCQENQLFAEFAG